MNSGPLSDTTLFGNPQRANKAAITFINCGAAVDRMGMTSGHFEKASTQIKNFPILLLPKSKWILSHGGLHGSQG